MDEVCSRAVIEVFVRLYEKGLIYRGKYMVNFCPGCRTVISDIEVEHQDTDGHLYYIQYPVLSDEDLTKARADAGLGTNGACQGAGAGQATDNAAPAQALRSFKSKIHTNTPAGGYEEFITVATTRPETMLGDTAIAVNPEDPRYGHLVGRYAVLPLVGGSYR